MIKSMLFTSIAAMLAVCTPSGATTDSVRAAPTGVLGGTVTFVGVPCGPGAGVEYRRAMAFISVSGVGAGTYYVRIRAGNAAGIGPSSNKSVLVVGAMP